MRGGGRGYLYSYSQAEAESGRTDRVRRERRDGSLIVLV